MKSETLLITQRPESREKVFSKKTRFKQKILFPTVKRTFDITFSLFVLLGLSPLFFAIALLVFASSPGKVLFSQLRLGKNGKFFRCYKFRTMYLDAESKLHDLLQKNNRMRKEWETRQKLRKDPRVFAFGKFLRKSSLDELPQFWNVLKGEMSVVGPRPYMVHQKQELGAYADTVLSIAPGITGLWQTSGRSGTSFRTRILLDAEYVHKKSFSLDLKIVTKTVYLLLFWHNAC